MKEYEAEPDIVTQQELRMLQRMTGGCAAPSADISRRVAGGAPIEPGPLSFARGRVICAGTKTKLDRLRVVSRLLDPDDFLLVSGNRAVYKKFRRDRARIFGLYLRELSAEVRGSYSVRLDHIRTSASWSGDYPALLHDTAAALLSLVRLRMALVLFVLRLPALVSVAGNVDRLLSYASAPQSYATVPN